MFGYILFAHIGQTDQISLALLLLENEANNPSHYFCIRKCVEAQGTEDGTVGSNIRGCTHIPLFNDEFYKPRGRHINCL